MERAGRKDEFNRLVMFKSLSQRQLRQKTGRWLPAARSYRHTFERRKNNELFVISQLHELQAANCRKPATKLLFI